MFCVQSCCGLFLFIHICNSLSVNVQKDSDISKTSINSGTIKLNDTLPVLAEGGTINVNSILINQTFVNLNKIENEEDGNAGHKSVSGRKGVVYQEDKFKISEYNKSSVNNGNFAPIHVKDTIDNTTFLSRNISKSNETIHKPMILSYEALLQTDENNKINIVENEPSVKVHVMSLSSHPGMIMPIVITILVVPMFAVVGYMALKRGKEAWKNRHYKRMDFLLDGMYND